MGDTLERGLDSNSPTVDAPPNSMKVGLRAHQQAVIASMEKTEQELISGMSCSDETLYSSYGILGDSVGVGKSLMVLAHIARLATLPPLPTVKSLGANSSYKMFSIKDDAALDMSGAGCLIVVPHTLFRQWSDYIKNQTNLTYLMIDKKRSLLQPSFREYCPRVRDTRRTGDRTGPGCTGNPTRLGIGWPGIGGGDCRAELPGSRDEQDRLVGRAGAVQSCGPTRGLPGWQG